MSEILTDNRFELIEKYKQELINATNIEDDKKEMAAIDNILFRFWQMGWLDKLEESDAGMTVSEYRERMMQAFHNADCDNLIAVVVLPTKKEFQHLEWLLKKEYVPFLERANGVDAVPVVRCCECKYFTEFEKGFSSDWDGSCRYWNTHSTVYSNFCGCAARMDEE